VTVLGCSHVPEPSVDAAHCNQGTREALRRHVRRAVNDFRAKVTVEAGEGLCWARGNRKHQVDLALCPISRRSHLSRVSHTLACNTQSSAPALRSPHCAAPTWQGSAQQPVAQGSRVHFHCSPTLCLGTVVQQTTCPRLSQGTAGAYRMYEWPGAHCSNLTVAGLSMWKR